LLLVGVGIILFGTHEPRWYATGHEMERKERCLLHFSNVRVLSSGMVCTNYQTILVASAKDVLCQQIDLEISLRRKRAMAIKARIEWAKLLCKKLGGVQTHYSFGEFLFSVNEVKHILSLIL
jgi:hypothetical protein